MKQHYQFTLPKISFGFYRGMMARPFHFLEDGGKRCRFSAFLRGAHLTEGTGGDSTLRSLSSCPVVDDGICFVETGTVVGTPLSDKARSR